MVLCLQPMLASPSQILLSSSAVTPPAAPLLIDVLKEDFLPIASKSKHDVASMSYMCACGQFLQSPAIQCPLLACLGSSHGNLTISARRSPACSSLVTTAPPRRPYGGSVAWKASLQTFATMRCSLLARLIVLLVLLRPVASASPLLG